MPWGGGVGGRGSFTVMRSCLVWFLSFEELDMYLQSVYPTFGGVSIVKHFDYICFVFLAWFGGFSWFIFEHLKFLKKKTVISLFCFQFYIWFVFLVIYTWATILAVKVLLYFFGVIFWTLEIFYYFVFWILKYSLLSYCSWAIGPFIISGGEVIFGLF